jgi:hypothetical protein
MNCPGEYYEMHVPAEYVSGLLQEMHELELSYE